MTEINWASVARKNRIGVLFILWLPFSLFALLSIFISLVVTLLAKLKEMDRIMRAMDKLMAAVLGFSGHYTMSAEMGRILFSGEKHSSLVMRLCGIIDSILSKLDPREGSHCRIEAIAEGILKG